MDLISGFTKLPALRKDIRMVTWDVMGSIPLPDSAWARSTALTGRCIICGRSVCAESTPRYINFFHNFAAFWEKYPSAVGSTWEIELFFSKAVRAAPDASTAYPYPHRMISAQQYVLPLLPIFHTLFVPGQHVKHL